MEHYVLSLKIFFISTFYFCFDLVKDFNCVYPLLPIIFNFVPPNANFTLCLINLQRLVGVWWKIMEVGSNFGLHLYIYLFNIMTMVLIRLKLIGCISGLIVYVGSFLVNDKECQIFNYLWLRSNWRNFLVRQCMSERYFMHHEKSPIYY